MIRNTDAIVGQPISYEAFCRLPEQAGLELIDGFMVKEPSPTYGHQSLVGHLHHRLAEFNRKQRSGKVLVAPLDVTLNGEHVLQPDVMWVSAARIGILTAKGLTAAPDLAVEVLSPSTRARDTGRKRELYFANGCRELWLIDPETCELELCEYPAAAAPLWSAHAYAPPAVVGSPLLKGFQLDLAELVEESRLP
ncbi:MAG TPA: Uma2 family endonuclease [Limnochordia bacterium]|nr:Uma2 family endonuclease [Limnochordia bacterium]